MFEKEVVVNSSVVIVRCYENEKGELFIDSIPIVTDAIDFGDFCNSNDDWFEQIEKLLQ